jgi:hypothetical protein
MLTELLLPSGSDLELHKVTMESKVITLIARFDRLQRAQIVISIP